MQLKLAGLAVLSYKLLKLEILLTVS